MIDEKGLCYDNKDWISLKSNTQKFSLGSMIDVNRSYSLFLRILRIQPWFGILKKHFGEKVQPLRETLKNHLVSLQSIEVPLC